MKRALVVGALALATLTACYAPGAELKTEVGDGTWKVGDNLKPGIWAPKTDWHKKSSCAWVVSANDAEVQLSSRDPGIKEVDLRQKGKTLTTEKCGPWHWVRKS